jgi:hypothetical protein
MYLGGYMKYIQIQNEGEVEVAGFSLMGASSKDGESTIGFFGSGNKYALATLLREGVEFSIYSGVRKVSIETKGVEFNGSVYEQILVDGETTSLTTRMGPDWELWFALRELISNAKDEGGFSIEVLEESECEPVEGKTIILIEEGPFHGIIENLDTYIRGDGTNQLASVETRYGTVDVIEPLDTHVRNFYRKGISVMPRNEDECLFWYDFGRIDINESRTYKYDFEVRERVESAIAGLEDERLIREFLRDRRQRPKAAESQLELNERGFSIAWYNVLKGKTVYPESSLQYLPMEDTSNGVIVPDGAAAGLSEEYPDLDVVGHGEKVYEKVAPSQRVERAVEKAFYNMMKIGYPVKCQIEYVKVFEDSTVAWYNMDADRIFLCVNHIDPNDQQGLMETLFEENLHARGFHDGSRRFANYLIAELIMAKLEINGVSNESEV